MPNVRDCVLITEKRRRYFTLLFNNKYKDSTNEKSLYYKSYEKRATKISLLPSIMYTHVL